MRRHLTDTEPRVVVTSAITLANSGRPDDVMTCGSGAAAADRGRARDRGRRAALKRPPRWRTSSIHGFARCSCRCSTTAITRVVQKAIRSARAMGASDGLFVPGLLSLLGHRALKAHGARGAGRLRRDDRWRPGARAARSARACVDSSSHSRDAGAARHAAVDGRARRVARRSRRLPALQGDCGDREDPARSPGDRMSAAGGRVAGRTRNARATTTA